MSTQALNLPSDLANSDLSDKVFAAAGADTTAVTRAVSSSFNSASLSPAVWQFHLDELLLRNPDVTLQGLLHAARARQPPSS